MDSQSIRVVGSLASLQWSDAAPGELRHEIQGRFNQILHHGMPYLDDSALAEERLGALHTEGLAESWYVTSSSPSPSAPASAAIGRRWPR